MDTTTAAMIKAGWSFDGKRYRKDMFVTIDRAQVAADFAETGQLPDAYIQIDFPKRETAKRRGRKLAEIAPKVVTP